MYQLSKGAQGSDYINEGDNFNIWFYFNLDDDVESLETVHSIMLRLNVLT